MAEFCLHHHKVEKKKPQPLVQTIEVSGSRIAGAEV